MAYAPPRLGARLCAAAALTLSALTCGLWAQPTSPLTPPANGPRRADPTWHALTGATVHAAPGQTIQNATVVIRDGRIVSVVSTPDGPDGKSPAAPAPAGARVWDCTGLHIYPGFIDAFVEVDAPAPDRTAPGIHWNSRVTPQRRALDGSGPDARTAESLRKLGFTAAAVTPRGGIFRGSSAVISLAKPASDSAADRPPVYRENAFQSIAFELAGRRGGAGAPGAPAAAPDESRWTGYPDSQMGAIALIRQTFIDADWQIQARASGAVIPPNCLDTIGYWSPPHRAAGDGGPAAIPPALSPLVFSTDDELEVLRAIKIAREFDRPAAILGCGTEFRRLEAIRSATAGNQARSPGDRRRGEGPIPIILPLNFPRTPDVSTIARAEGTELADLMTWEQAPTNPRRLDQAGLLIALTTARLRDRAQFEANLQKALKHGLNPEHALAMLTTAPARILNIDDRLGMIAPGMVANLIVADGDLFDPWPRKPEHSPADAASPGSSGSPAPESGKPGAEKPDARPTPQPLPPGEGAKPGAPEGQPERAATPAEPGKQANPAKDSKESDVGKDGKDAAPEEAKRPRIRDVWIDGLRHEINPAPASGLAGTWAVEFLPAEGQPAGLTLIIDQSNAITVQAGGKKARARGVKVDAPRFTFTVDDEELGLKGSSLVSGLLEGDALYGEAITSEGARVKWRATRTQAAPPGPQARGDTPEGGDEGAPLDQTDPSRPASRPGPGEPRRPAAARDAQPEGDRAQRGPRKSRETLEREAIASIPEELGLPYGPYMLDQAPPQPNLLITGATLWTSGPRGIIPNGALFISGGKVAFVGTIEEWNRWLADKRLADLRELHLAGKHIAPGIIDCHSHTGISRGVNEGGQAVTAEVRIADVTDPDAISWYRQLAAGVTCVNSLHGSANAIGGQNCVNKIRWGVPHPDQMHMEGARGGIKFALGENPKQSNWGDRQVTRYPQTRMGVETLIRDRFTAAAEYRKARDEEMKGRAGGPARGSSVSGGSSSAPLLPIRRDLELEALAEILAGERLVHCHSYRQDEILMLCRVSGDFGFQIGTFQHVLEGYKVADEIARHARGGSCFSDWWAYKVEVQDAIPENGAIMHDQGVTVSFNSDSDELARRLNSESGKAVKYGGLPPEEALKFVTINPAFQLGIEGRVGSLETGKDADFAIWSGPPVSIQSRCEATYVDGRCYFSLDQDRRHRERIAAERHRLIQKALAAGRNDRERPEASRPRDGGLEGPWYGRPTEDEQPAPRGMLARYYLDLMNRGMDPAAARQGECGCEW
jgi:imidazolonepropionase-like amidohydrolase